MSADFSIQQALTGKHLAQLNIGQLRYSLEDPRLEVFMSNLQRVNAAAERMPGFVWRFIATDDVAPFDSQDSRVIANLSVWSDAESLKNFIWKTVHKSFLDRKEAWFKPMEQPHMVFWPVEIGTQPNLAEAGARLARLRTEGPSSEAFGMEALGWR